MTDDYCQECGYPIDIPVLELLKSILSRPKEELKDAGIEITNVDNDGCISLEMIEKLNIEHIVVWREHRMKKEKDITDNEWGEIYGALVTQAHHVTNPYVMYRKVKLQQLAKKVREEYLIGLEPDAWETEPAIEAKLIKKV